MAHRRRCTTEQIWPASHLIASWDGYPNMFVQVARDYQAATDAKYVNGFVTDTISLDRLTIIGGVRFDHQESSLERRLGARRRPASRSCRPLSAPAVERRLQVEQPHAARRHHLSRVDEARKTVVRASYAMFASQLPGDEAKFVSPIQYSYAYYNAVDRNGDGVAQLERDPVQPGAAGLQRVRSDQPGASVDGQHASTPNVKAPITHEFLFGIDREIVPQLRRQRARSPTAR